MVFIVLLMIHQMLLHEYVHFYIVLPNYKWMASYKKCMWYNTNYVKVFFFSENRNNQTEKITNGRFKLNENDAKKFIPNFGNVALWSFRNYFLFQNKMFVGVSRRILLFKVSHPPLYSKFLIRLIQLNHQRKEQKNKVQTNSNELIW